MSTPLRSCCVTVIFLCGGSVGQTKTYSKSQRCSLIMYNSVVCIVTADALAPSVTQVQVPYAYGTSTWSVNSLVPERCGSNLKYMIFKVIIQNSSLSIHYEVAPWWMPQNLTDEKSTFVRIMAWCLQAPSHYLEQCWPICKSPCDITTQTTKDIGSTTIRHRSDTSASDRCLIDVG